MRYDENGKEVKEPTSEYCCSGIDCGCQGVAVDFETHEYLAASTPQQMAEKIKQLKQEFDSLVESSNELVDNQQKKIEELEKENAELKEVIEDVISIADESEGITGWHLNGEVLLWKDVEYISTGTELLETKQKQEG